MTPERLFEIIDESKVRNTVNGDWDRKTAELLRGQSFTQDQIGIVLGLLAEHRQCADGYGFTRGYNTGYNAGLDRGKGLSE